MSPWFPFMCYISHCTFTELVWRPPPEVHNVLLGQAEFVLQCPFLTLQHGHTGFQLLYGVLHVPVLHTAGPRTGLTETHQSGGHPGRRGHIRGLSFFLMYLLRDATEMISPASHSYTILMTLIRPIVACWLQPLEHVSMFTC